MIIIPARLGSTRFPNKVLVDINGLPMVIATAKQVEKIDKVVIATDSKEVIDRAKDFGFEAIMTSSEHKSGTDRINEVAQKLSLKNDEIIINVQADEPFIEPEVVQKVYDRVKSAIEKNEEFMMVSCYKRIDNFHADDPNLVKVVLDDKNRAIYFSRSKIPYNRGEIESYFGHIGIYGFSKKSLSDFCSLPTALLEDIEKLEQLRALYYGKKILMVEVETSSFGIDTVKDLERAMSLSI
jgi:3-deoxy-manno-octulosonate cytidylyltransferase (CMP-KDO synthetase)